MQQEPNKPQCEQEVNDTKALGAEHEEQQPIDLSEGANEAVATFALALALAVPLFLAMESAGAPIWVMAAVMAVPMMLTHVFSALVSGEPVLEPLFRIFTADGLVVRLLGYCLVYVACFVFMAGFWLKSQSIEFIAAPVVSMVIAVILLMVGYYLADFYPKDTLREIMEDVLSEEEVNVLREQLQERECAETHKQDKRL